MSISPTYAGPLALGDELPALKQTDDVLGARWIALSALDEVELARNVREIVSLALEKVDRFECEYVHPMTDTWLMAAMCGWIMSLFT